MAKVLVSKDNMHNVSGKLEGEKWDFTQYPILGGIFLDLLELKGEDGEDYQAAQFQVNGEPVFCFCSQVLQKKLSEVSPPKLIIIEYLGERQSGKSKRRYHDYDVYVSEIPPEYDPENLVVRYDPEQQGLEVEFLEDAEDNPPF